MRASLDGRGRLNGIGASVPFYPGGQYGSFLVRSQSPGVAAAILAV